ncbi:hypothetical protein CANARDRAFT_8894 [[Candida] arabinofermentans NRRL YB-2248]|uniref:CS domain-containing protein n=1 Tax=[Candida] arabinofermentans NRRL YB-2248 TaxID=983967 RepID=A0A1E4SXJ7_9ASCO|nr:hypothetical protein CANARDRAFT_8894 [[Candida] arabinofermentans NRRL YB-2248]
MITPSFTVSQDDEFLYIKVMISNIRFSAQAIEMVVDDNVFIFSLAPYYLRLRFSNSLIDDERSHSEFVPHEECISVKIPKLNTGEFFKDLDLTAKLLARLNEPTATPSQANIAQSGTGAIKRPLIEEVGSTTETYEHDLQKIEQEAEDFNWEVEQKLPELMGGVSDTAKLTQTTYGFNNQYSGMLEMSLSNGNDINDLSSPDTLDVDARIMERMINENIKFDPEYYANDYLTAKYFPEDTNIKEILDWKLPMKKLFLKFQQSKHNGETQNEFVDIEFDKEETERMNNLPRKSYLVDDLKSLYYTIVCILYSYSYELRSNMGETTVESGWVVGKVTPQISCLDTQLIQSNNQTETSMLRVLVLTMTRRSLCYPLIRDFNLVQKTWEDVYYTLRCGKRGILKTLLAARELFRFHDVYYIYCKVLLDDLCSWTLRDDGCNERILRNLSHELKKEFEALKKKDIGFEKIMNPPTEEQQAEGVEGELEFINLEDIEELAEESYAMQQ